MERFQLEHDVEVYCYDSFIDEAIGLSKEDCDIVVKAVRIRNPSAVIRVTERCIDNARYGPVKE